MGTRDEPYTKTRKWIGNEKKTIYKVTYGKRVSTESGKRNCKKRTGYMCETIIWFDMEWSCLSAFIYIYIWSIQISCKIKNCGGSCFWCCQKHDTTDKVMEAVKQKERHRAAQSVYITIRWIYYTTNWKKRMGERLHDNKI